MASTSLVDYQVLHDVPFTISAAAGVPSQQDLSWEVPSDINFEDGPRRPILAFKILVLEQSTSIVVNINSREAFKLTNMDKSHTRGYWEAINVPDVFPNNTSFPTINPITMFAADGGAIISDVIIWYQVNV